MDTFSAELVRLRSERQWTAYRLASEAGLPRQTVSGVERRGRATLETLVRLAKALDVPVATLSPTAADLLDGVRVR
jgi:transcriptional regulator with XRE-family HTH domain